MSGLRHLVMWLSLLIAWPCMVVVMVSHYSFMYYTGSQSCESLYDAENTTVRSTDSLVPFVVRCVVYERGEIVHDTSTDIGTPTVIVGFVASLTFLGAAGRACGRPWARTGPIRCSCLPLVHRCGVQSTNDHPSTY
ncbi:hypothetical protein EYE40_04930 [Glaciihabitans arcticus]|uniref:Uncharacterized protein n=1 Tax=Glaciihabitans arcticus TaxID=2668039 RepID=A0A4Q9GPR7_9MICO|nr:hypothetical protein [Glaciihabitans arcticus]TBN56796.1 hypothetical protein EYE40_04930 [Glaciihabitans arcticus]